MANLILTGKCNKNCSFCFAHGDRSIGEMGLDLVQWVVDQKPVEIKLLGGEPTLHSRFPEILDIVGECSLITNLLCDDDTIDAINNSKVTSLLVNCSEVFGDRLRIWERNINNLTCDNVTLSFTISLPTNDYHTNYLDMILDIYHPAAMRVSLDMKSTVPHIVNMAEGQQLIDLLKICYIHEVPMTVDCIALPCMFTPNQLRMINIRTACLSSPADIFPDWTLRYCYPVQSIQRHLTRDSNLNNEIRDIAIEYMKIVNQQERPSRCLRCTYSAQCSPCLAMVGD